MKDLSEYRVLNKASLYREFKEKYNYPHMQITSYRRVLYGESTYFDLLDSEFFGRKNTLLDVLIAEEKPSKETMETLGKKAEALNNIRLCDLNDNNRKIYEDVQNVIRR